jgi:hypothetical protein
MTSLDSILTARGLWTGDPCPMPSVQARLAEASAALERVTEAGDRFGWCRHRLRDRGVRV